tara:strand:- start:444 stop:1358 length:915 start_codon:yes stop_codon:yes gene_type:complete
MTGLVDRKQYNLGGIDKEQLATDTKTITDLLAEYAPVENTKVPYGQFGLNLASGMTVTDALKDPYKQFTKADDIRRAQIAKRGQGALSTAINMQLKKPKTTRTLTEAEAKKMGFPAGSIVQQKSDGTISVPLKPSAKQMEQRTNLEGTIGLLNKIELNYNKAGKPVGKFYNLDPDRIKGEIGKFTGSEQGKTFATLQADIRKTTVFLTKAISGAQVSDKEREYIELLIPSIGDTEIEFEAKLKSLRSYLGDAAKRYGGDVEAMMKAGVSAQDYLPTKEKNLEDMNEQELMEYRKQLQEQQNNTP